MRKVKEARSDTKIFPEVQGDIRSISPAPRLAPLVRLCSRGLLARIPAPNLARNGVGKVTFANVKQPPDPRTKCSLRDALFHSGTVSSKIASQVPSQRPSSASPTISEELAKGTTATV